MNTQKLIYVTLLILLFISSAYSATTFIPPVVGNIDASTISDEILTTTFDGRLYAWKAERTLANGVWPVEFEGVICAAPTLADLDANPADLEILVPVCSYSNTYKLYGIQGNGSALSGWIKDLNFEVYSSPAVGNIDINGDNKKEKVLFIGSRNGSVYAYEIDNWKILPDWPKIIDSSQPVSPACADIDSDGADELIVTTNSGKIVTFDFDSNKWQQLSSLNISAGISSAPEIEDLDRDQTKELIVGAGNGTVYVWTWNAENKSWISKWSLSTGGSALSTPIAANIDADKELEIVCYSAEGKIYIINNNGSLLSSKTINRGQVSGIGKKGVTLPEVLTSEFFYSFYGTNVTAVNEKKSSHTVTEWGIFHHYKQPYIIGLFPSIDPFSPNNDGRKDTTQITSQINSVEECDLKLGIYDSKGLLIKKIKEAKYKPSGAEQFLWDGKSDYSNGEVVASNTYNILLELESAYSDQINQLNTVTVDNIPPGVSKVSETKSIISPDGDGVDEDTIISYAVSEPCEVTISFVDSSGKNYKTYKEFVNTALDPQPFTIHKFTWDGYGNSNQLFSGKYKYTVTAEDFAANTASSKAGQIEVDVDPPLINGVYAEPKVFSTKSSINSTKLHYAVSEDSKVSISVCTSDRNVVKHLLIDEIKVFGTHEMVWNGTDNNNSYLTDGYYTYSISAIDQHSFKSNTIEAVVEIDSIPPSILQTNVSPQEFSPKASTGTYATLSFLISEKAKVSIDILYSQDKVIKNIKTDDPVEAGTYSYLWDGTDSQEIPVSDGTYRFKITAIDTAGNKKETFVNVIANSTPPSISNLSASPNPFTPNGDSLGDVCSLHYTLSGGICEVRVSLKILNSSGSTVKTLVDNQVYYSGNYTEYWYGEVDKKGGIGDSNNDGIADEDDYTYQITAVDSHGNKAEAKEIISAVPTKPVFTISANPLKFSPNGDSVIDETLFTYSVNYASKYISNDASIAIDIKDQQNRTVFSKSFSHTSGTYTYKWDGKKNDGSDLNEGKYTVIISGRDALGAWGDPKSINVEIVYAKPVITIVGDDPDPFSPNKNNLKDKTIISYKVSKPSKVTVEIKNISGIQSKGLGDNLVKSLQNEELKEKDVTHTVNWDGCDTSQNMVGDGIYNYLITAIDDAGNSNSSSGSVTVDNTPPQAPLLDIIYPYTNQQQLTISGTAEPGSLVEIFNNGSFSNNITAGAAFSCPIDLNLGENQIKARTTDPAGNISDYSANQLVNFETDSPVINNISASPDPARPLEVIISFVVSENLKNNPEVSIIETARSAVFCSKSGQGYTYKYNVLTSDPQGTTTILIKVTDLAGNVSTNKSVSFLVDTIAPGQPVVDNIKTPTNIQRQTISGNAEAGAHIKIYNNNKLAAETNVLSSGSFSKDINLTLGDNLIIVEAIDAAGNISASSLAQTVNFDTTAPVFSSTSTNPNPAKKGAATIAFIVSKTLKSNPLVWVNGNAASFISKNDFNYSYVYNISGNDTQGPAEITMQAEDLAGNTGYGIEYFEIDTIDPFVSNTLAVPDPAKQGIVSISFKASEKLDSDPIVGVSETKRSAVLFSKSGLDYTYSYDVKSDDPQGASNVSISVTDLAKNSCSDNSLSFVVDTVKPAFSNIKISPNPAKEGKVTITFDSSEKLESNPAMTVNGKTALIDSSLSKDLNYTFSYNVLAGDKQGAASVIISGKDLALNLGSGSSSFIIDTIKPQVSEIKANPYQAKAGPVDITFKVSEELAALSVKINGNSAAFIEKVKTSGEINYTYRYNVSSTDKQGGADIEIEATDLAGNIGNEKSTFIIDTIPPSFNNISASPDPAKVGNVIISFSVSEQLKDDPDVTINGNTATYDPTSSGLNYVYIYPVSLVDENGTATINISGIDLALNSGMDNSGSFIIDTKPPSFSSIKVSADPAKAGPLTISFKVSETLLSEPTVTVNGNPAALSSQTGLDYSFNYNITSSDKQSLAQVSITGQDLAKNSWIDQSALFVIDTEAPNITINGRGANPNPFTPNMLETTSFDFTVSDTTTKAKVDSVKIYNSSGSLIKTLNEGTVTWDGKVEGGVSDNNNDTYADEGIYTFKVHAIDDAGNENLKSATILVNRIVLHLAPPASPTKPVNPTPFSPSVSSEIVITFALGQDSNGPSWSDKYLAKGLRAKAVDPIGTVQVEVQTTSGALIKTLLPNSSNTGKREAGTHQITWNGKNSNGQVVESGTYKIVVTAKDLVGNPAENKSSLTYDFVVDKEPPSGSVKILGDAKYTTSANVTLTLDASDTHSKVVKMRISNDGTFDNEAVEDYSSSKSWSLASGNDGARTVSVVYQDEAGNWSGAFSDSIILDQTAPGIPDLAVSASPFNQMYNSTTITCSINEDCSDQIKFEAGIYTSDDKLVKSFQKSSDGLTSKGSKSLTWNGQNDAGDYVNEGTYMFRIRAWDEANNESAWQIKEVKAEDDQRISNSSINSTNPFLGREGNSLFLRWIEGNKDINAPTITASGGEFNDWYDKERDSKYVSGVFTIDHTHELSIKLLSSGGYGSAGSGNCFYKIKYDTGSTPKADDSGVDVPGAYWARWGGVDETVKFTISAGKYYLWTRVIIGKRADASISMSTTPSDRKYNQYSSSSSDSGKNWTPPSAPTEVDSYSTGPTILNYYGSIGETVHEVVPEGNLYYRKGTITDYITFYDRTCNAIAPFDWTLPYDKVSEETFSINYQQDVIFEVWQYGIGGCWIYDNNNNELWHYKQTSPPSAATKVINLSNGTYKLKAVGSFLSISAKYKEKVRTESAISWSDNAKITHLTQVSVIFPSITKDLSGNVYVAWSDNRSGIYQIYFQKIPSNFAPISGSVSNALSVSVEKGNKIKSAALITKPVLLSPSSEAEVNSLRPTFKWLGVNGILEYSIQCSNDTNFTTHREFKKSVSSSEANPQDNSTPKFAFTIHEFEEGLETKNSLGDPLKWYWRAGALNGSNITWSHNANDFDLWYFTIQLPLSISKVSNYPNPFNPNKESTKIRYKLGCEADDVKIRIYDLTGALVKELNGETAAEGPDIWTEKYHDIVWDGKNGMGDMVLNSIYPFEVIATKDGQSVSGRGKIAVLK